MVVFKPGIDDRYTDDSVGSHSGERMRSVQISTAEDIPARVGDAQVIGIDEAQFLGPELVGIVEELANAGKRVVVAGLDMDYRGAPFSPMPQLLAVAEYIDKVLTRITLPGSIFLAAIAVLPIYMYRWLNVPFYFGGTSLLIVVGVALDTIQQMESHLLMRHYEGFMKKSKVPGRRAM